MKNFIKDNALTVITILASVLTIAIGLIAWQHYLIKYRLPDIEHSLSQYKNDQDQFIAKSESIIQRVLEESRKELSEGRKESEKRLIKVEGSLSKIRISLIALMNKVGKTPSRAELNDLISSTDEYSEYIASDFKTAKFSKPDDQLPSIKKFENWADVAKYMEVPEATYGVTDGTHNPKEIKYLIKRSLLSDETNWQVKDTTLTVDYDTGTILFIPNNDISPQELQKMAVEFNEIKNTITTLPSKGSFKKLNDE